MGIKNNYLILAFIFGGVCFLLASKYWQDKEHKEDKGIVERINAERAARGQRTIPLS